MGIVAAVSDGVRKGRSEEVTFIQKTEGGKGKGERGAAKGKTPRYKRAWRV